MIFHNNLEQPIHEQSVHDASHRPVMNPVHDLAIKMATPGSVVTWLNHWSIGQADWDSLGRVGAIGVDGTLLQMILRAYGFPISRTSADLVLPVFFSEVLAEGSRVAIIGAAPGVAKKAAAKLKQHDTLAIDGYEELAQLRAHPQELIEYSPDVIVLGLGARLQEEVALELHQLFPRATICTAGGWIDQFAAKEQYFPAWIHKYRLGWAWRIIHEPRRLIGRYTRDAVGFMRTHRALLRNIHCLPHTPTATSFDRS